MGACAPRRAERRLLSGVVKGERGNASSLHFAGAPRMSRGAVALSSPSGRRLTAEELRFATALARKLEAAKLELEADEGWSLESGSPPHGGPPRARGVLDPVGPVGLEEMKRVAPQRRGHAREGLKAEQGRSARERGCVQWDPVPRSEGAVAPLAASLGSRACCHVLESVPGTGKPRGWFLRFRADDLRQAWASISAPSTQRN